MKNLVHFLRISHPAGGWFKKESSAKRKRKATKQSSSLSPDSYHTRAGVKKKDNPRYNPAP